jgi:hypothetical protein
MSDRRATKTSTLRALRSVNDAMRLAVSCVSYGTSTEVFRDAGGITRVNRRQLTSREKSGQVEAALRWLHTAESRLGVARDHLLSLQARHDAAAEVEEREAS